MSESDGSVLEIGAVCQPATCHDPSDHGGHVWYHPDRRPRWCAGVAVVHWANVVLEQQGRDQQAEQ